MSRRFDAAGVNPASGAFNLALGPLSNRLEAAADELHRLRYGDPAGPLDRAFAQYVEFPVTKQLVEQLTAT